ncbi:MAG TPA: S8 family serine peptidase, partial [bacterium]|nr:S8 family serine peptidase [bacterium]
MKTCSDRNILRFLWVLMLLFALPLTQAQALTPNDPMYPLNYAFTATSAPAAWDITTSDSTVKIGVVDSGLDLDHPDLAAHINTTDDYDFVNTDAVAQDDHGHGTAMAGIIGAVTNNGTAIAGVNWQGTLLPVKVLNAELGTSQATAAQGIAWASGKGAKVICMGFVFTSTTTALDNAITAAYNGGATLVAPMGNDGGSYTRYPAANSYVIAVGSVGPGKTVSSFSNRGSHIDVVAPGETIPTTYLNDAVDTVQGTSYAAAYVAGVVSLLYAVNPNLTPAEVYTIISTTAKDLGASGYDSTYGYGLVDVYAAVRAAQVTTKVQPRAANGTGTPASLTPQFVWSSVSGETSYRVVVKTGAAGTVLADTIVTGTSVLIPSGSYSPALVFGTTYYWNVKPILGRWSTFDTFTPTAAAAPVTV